MTNDKQLSFQEEMEGERASSEENPEVAICLVCGSKVNFHQMENRDDNQLLKNLRVIFLLRNLLQVPKWQVERNLRECGNPENWIKLCDNCSELTLKGEELYRIVEKINKELKSIQNIIVNKIRSENHDDNGELEKNRNRREIWRRTRDFVTNYAYQGIADVDNPFEEGDKRAENLARVNVLHKPVSPSILGNHSNSDEDEDKYDDNLSVCLKREPDELEEPDDMNEGHDYDDDNWQPETFQKTGKKMSPQPGRKKHRKIEKINGKWKCRHCDRLFNNQNAHYSICSICGEAFDAKICILPHKRRKHHLNADGSTYIPKPKPVTSPKRTRVRRKRVPPTEQLNGDFKKTRTKKYTKVEKIFGKFKCRHCDQLFNNRNAHYHHEVTKHPNTPKAPTQQPIESEFQKSSSGKLKCHFCDEEFSHGKERLAHEQDEHLSSEGDFKCDICGKGRSTVNSILHHKRFAHNIGWDGRVLLPAPPKVWPKDPQTCHLCGKGYTSIYGLKNHLRNTHEKRCGKFCQFCGLRTNSEMGLIKHILGRHKGEEEAKKLEEDGVKIWKCEVVGCAASYSKEGGLERHREKFHGGGDEDGVKGEEVKRFKCSFCGKGFWHWHKLNRHEEIHRLGGEKPWKCGRCGVAFSTKQYLRDHERRVHQKNKEDE